MKVARNIRDPEFVPFELTFKIESVSEANALYAIFNHTDNTRLLPPNMASAVKDALGVQYRVNHGVIANSVTAGEFYV